MRLLVLGASGRCGDWLTRAAVGRGHDVTAVVRPSSQWSAPEGATELRGEVLDASFVAGAVEGHTDIVSCLGIRRARLLPWGSLRSPADLVQVVMKNLVDSVPPAARLMWLSAAGVHTSRRQLSLAARTLVRIGDVGTAYRDLEAAERIVRESGRPWLTVRPVTLLPGLPTGRVGPVGRYRLWSVVRRSDVATWMLDVADGSLEYRRSEVLLGSGRRGG